MVNAYVKLLRLDVCLLAVLGLIVGGLVSGLGIPIPFYFLAAWVVVFLVCGGGNVINDYYDYETDKVNKTHRPLPSGQITMKGAKFYGWLLLLFGNIIAFAFFTPSATVFVIINTVIVWLYSFKLKRTPIGHLVDSWLAASPFILAGILFSNLNTSLIILAVISFFGNMGREIVKGIEDMKGDSYTGMKTFEIYLGKWKAMWVTIISILLAVVLSFVPYIYGKMDLVYLIIIILADFIFVYSLSQIKKPNYCQKIMKLGMFVAMAAFLIGTILI